VLTCHIEAGTRAGGCQREICACHRQQATPPQADPAPLPVPSDSSPRRWPLAWFIYCLPLPLRAPFLRYPPSLDSGLREFGQSAASPCRPPPPATSLLPLTGTCVRPCSAFAAAPRSACVRPVVIPPPASRAVVVLPAACERGNPLPPGRHGPQRWGAVLDCGVGFRSPAARLPSDSGGGWSRGGGWLAPSFAHFLENPHLVASRSGVAFSLPFHATCCVRRSGWNLYLPCVRGIGSWNIRTWRAGRAILLPLSLLL
jgi:hypothetical protein